MIPLIDALYELRYFTKLDYYFAKSICRLAEETSPLVLLGAATASSYARNGHVCVPLDDIAGSLVKTLDGDILNEFVWPKKDPWKNALLSSPIVGGPIMGGPQLGDGNRPKPLVLQGDRLYLFRYWQYENRLALELIRRGEPLADKPNSKNIAEIVDVLFPRRNAKIKHQRQAAMQAVQNHLTIISGGPGTGKTTTVLKILMAVLALLPSEQKNNVHIMLMAPTGKAAARLSESIQSAKAALSLERYHSLKDTLDPIPDSATTIHKALKTRYDNPTRFIHTRDNPLPAEIVVVDEASMIDVALMTKLLEAVPATGRILLLGDKNQLASVEAGSVLGDICDFCRADNQSHPLSSCVVHLRHSFRFDATKGIGRLAAAINTGSQHDTLRAFEEDQNKEIRFIDCEMDASLEKHVSKFIFANYQKYLDKPDPLECLEEFEKFRILCAHKRGPGSVEHLNKLSEDILREHSSLSPNGEWYERRPILVTRNDNQLGLWNGDLGIVLRRDENTGELAGFFRGENLKQRVCSIARLPQCETVFAMTAHKSQGSEYDEVLLVLPAHPSPILTRELIYTAVTRARQRVTILGRKRILEFAIGNTVRRTSGLKQLLFNYSKSQLSFEFS